jgi:electron transfer flavoprotein alpha subunit
MADRHEQGPTGNPGRPDGEDGEPQRSVAIGISGSSLRTAVIRNAAHVISVNPGRHAAIGGLSDIVVEGDGTAFVEALLERLEATSTQTHGGGG